MRVHAEEPELTPIQRLLHRTVWSRRLLGAIAELRDRFPEASLEVAALEVALADAAQELEAALCASPRGGAGRPGGAEPGPRVDHGRVDLERVQHPLAGAWRELDRVEGELRPEGREPRADLP